MIYELISLVSIVYTNLLLRYYTILKINYFASALHKHTLYRINLNAVCLCFLTLCIPAIQLFISAFGRPFRVCRIWMNGVVQVKMAAMPIYGKNHKKIFFSGTGGPISTKLGV